MDTIRMGNEQIPRISRRSMLKKDQKREKFIRYRVIHSNFLRSIHGSSKSSNSGCESFRSPASSSQGGSFSTRPDLPASNLFYDNNLVGKARELKRRRRLRRRDKT